MARSGFRFRDFLFIFGAAFALSVSSTTVSAQPNSGTTEQPDRNAGTLTFFDTAVVTATREQEPTREVPTNLTILGQDVIKTSTAKTVTDLLVEQGFNSVPYNDVAGVQIRGFGQLAGPPENTNTVLILMDGRRTGNANLTLIGLENVDRVEIVRGPSAVQYGSSAMGGVVNIITKRGTSSPIASLELGAGTDKLTREKLSLSGAGKGFDFALGATNYGRNDLTTEGGREWFHTAIDHNTNVNVAVGYSINANNRAGVTYDVGDIHSQLSNSGIRPYSGNTPTAPFTKYQKKTNNTAFSYAGNAPGKAWDWSTSYSFGNYDQKPYANNLGTKFFNAQGNYSRSLFSASLGVDDYTYDSDPSAWTMKDVGTYATGKVRLLKDQVIVSGGIRFDSYTNESAGLTNATRNHAGGSIGVAYLPVRRLKLRANYAEGFKVPAPEQVAGDGAVYYLPNASLQPEQSKTYEFGSDADWKFVSAGVTWFHADWDNKIIGLVAPGACSGGFGCYQYQNLKSSTLAGLEGTLSSDIARAFASRVSLSPYVTFTWLQTRKNRDSSQFIDFNGSQNDTLPNTPDWMVSYGVRYTDPRLKLGGRLNAVYYGDVLTQDYSVVDFVTVFDAPYIHRPTGTVVNLSLDKELATLAGPHHKVTVRGEINNLLDGANEMAWSYPGPGRSFYVGVRYDY